MEVLEKLKILADAAKYDASCSSSGGVSRGNKGIGSISSSGICHSYSSDGRCISLLKILLTNCCIYDCKYCLNRKSNNIKRAIFEPEEICELTINFYKRNYIEGLFLSSGIIKSADYTMELLIKTVELLRNKYQFRGYIHCKAIPGCSEILLKRLGLLIDRVSANIELATDCSLKLLAPQKNSEKTTKIMAYVKNNRNKLFVPAGESTQIIVGATNDSDLDIISKSEDLYRKYDLKRVFYSAYIPVNKDNNLPSINLPPLKREHRLYQADFLMRFYHFKSSDLLNKGNKNFDLLVDPKVNYALNNLELYPVEINKASYEMLLKVPGIGVKSAKKIISSRKYFKITYDDLLNMNISLKRAKYFITIDGKYYKKEIKLNKEEILNKLLLEDNNIVQLSLFNE